MTQDDADAKREAARAQMAEIIGDGTDSATVAIRATAAAMVELVSNSRGSAAHVVIVIGFLMDATLDMGLQFEHLRDAITRLMAGGNPRSSAASLARALDEHTRGQAAS